MAADPTAALLVAGFLARRERERAVAIVARSHERVAAVPSLVAILVARGATRIWLFGSLAWGGAHESSDIDLATEGLAADELLRAQGELLCAAPAPVDLVRLEEAPPELAARVRADGRCVYG